jgi:Flp pilus assembly protein TadD
MTFHRFRPSSVAVALGFALLAGCQTTNQHLMPTSPLPALGEKTPKLSPSQVADLKIAMGRSLEKQGEIDRATATYLEALRLDPNRGDAYGRLAILADQQGKFTESDKWYRKALAAQPGNPDIFCNKGYSLYLQRQWTEAEMNLRQALALAPEHRRAHNNLGLVLAHTGRSEDALAEFRKGGCGKADSHANLAFALTLQRQWPEARQHYRLALKANPASTSARKGLDEVSALLAKADREQPPLARRVRPIPSPTLAQAPPPETREWIARGARPTSADDFFDVGHELYSQRRWAEAETNLRQAVALAPNLPRAHNYLGLVMAQTDRSEEALAEFQKGGCSLAYGHANVALVLSLQRRWTEARRHYQLALEADASCPAAQRGLQRVEQLMATEDKGQEGMSRGQKP